jgi:hypothetical protein
VINCKPLELTLKMMSYFSTEKGNAGRDSAGTLRSCSLSFLVTRGSITCLSLYNLYVNEDYSSFVFGFAWH